MVTLVSPLGGTLIIANMAAAGAGKEMSAVTPIRGASLLEGRLYLVHGEHNETFKPWMEKMWKLTPKNNDLRDYVLNITADLLASVGEYQPPECRNTGRINFAASSVMQMAELMLKNGELPKNESTRVFLAFCNFEEEFDETNIINKNPFDLPKGTYSKTLMMYSQNVSFCKVD